MSYEYTMSGLNLGLGDVETAERLLTQARTAFDAGRYSESLNLARQAEVQDPSNLMRYQMAQIFPMVRLGQCLQAENIYNRYRQQASRDPNISSYESAVRRCTRAAPDFETVPIVEPPSAFPIPGTPTTPSTTTAQAGTGGKQSWITGSIEGVFNAFLTKTGAGVATQAADTAVQTAVEEATNVAGGVGSGRIVSSASARAALVARNMLPYVVVGGVAITLFAAFAFFMLREKKPKSKKQEQALATRATIRAKR